MEMLRKKPVIVRRVFADGLEHEFALIRSAILMYPFVSVDTEYPGTIFKPCKQIIQQNNPAINYEYMKSNVDALELIQLGLTLSNSEGNLPDFGTACCYVWEFNFKDFDVDEDDCDKESIELLKRQGIDFVKNREKGIASSDFAMLMWNSGLFSNCFGGLTWLTFHGAYDFGFLMKILTQRPLPVDIHCFMRQLVFIFGGKIFDIKHTFKFFGLFGGLEKVAGMLNVTRLTGSTHQAGSDSLLTLQCFMEMKKSRVFEFNQSPNMLPALALYGLISILE
ncbi:putative CCR4-associated factor 1-like protein 9 [Hibiscus syriacus]|uniref:poly(A)-specific ribonuclease n=1 Tax=Hibiscus syriacus TaxID=106335 RepID=A0A6A2ZH99_HIBSY|nr:probable CCR4-associated factor 1 homolog 11 [Hibiscus syriacus]KAE8691374.1 putative CCR4-associated factor 1-like protein 9 [Hibiscus syriacus]